MTTYRITAEARRTLTALLLGVVAVAVYAVWNLGALLTSGVQGPEWVMIALMITILLLSPAVAWMLLAEAQVWVATDATGLTWHTLGVQLHYDWAQVRAVTAPTASLAETLARSAGPSAEPGTLPTGPALPTAIDGSNVLAPIPATDTVSAYSSADPTAGPLYLTVEPPAPARIAQPLLRLLYRQAYGSALPLPAGLAARSDLLAEVAARSV
ncbi:MAG: hypothetical protein M3Z04_19655 [Chloroflexota bacterium]|nr:hypothetical protein [Chloroflexota bacterium]